MALVQEIVNAINLMIDEKISKSGYAKVRTGRIETVNSDGTYDVIIDGQEMTNIGYIGKDTLTVNTIVRVLYPDNQATQAIILTIGGGSSGNYEETSNKVTSISSSSTDTQYPSAKAVYSYAENKSNKTTSISSSSTDIQYPSALTVYNYAENKGNKTTSISSSSTDTQYPSALTVYNYAENKGNKITSISSSSTDTQYPSALAVYNYVYNQIYSALNSSY